MMMMMINTFLYRDGDVVEWNVWRSRRCSVDATVRWHVRQHAGHTDASCPLSLDADTFARFSGRTGSNDIQCVWPISTFKQE